MFGYSVYIALLRSFARTYFNISAHFGRFSDKMDGVWFGWNFSCHDLAHRINAAILRKSCQFHYFFLFALLCHNWSGWFEPCFSNKHSELAMLWLQYRCNCITMIVQCSFKTKHHNMCFLHTGWCVCVPIHEFGNIYWYMDAHVMAFSRIHVCN